MTTAASFLDNRHWVILEQIEERKAIATVAESDFTACAKASGYKTEITVHTIKRDGSDRCDIFRAQDIYKAWNTYYGQYAPESVRMCTLAGAVPSIADHFLQWLTTSGYGKGGRYRRIQSEQDRAWLHVMAELVITRRIMEAKYRNNAFADEFTREQMTYAMFLRQMRQNLIKDSLRVVRISTLQGYDSNAATWAREQMLQTFNDLLTQHMAHVKRAIPEPLPPLPPADATRMLALPALTDEDAVEKSLWQ